MILSGGLALIGGAIGFLSVFSYLAAKFDYPEVLDGRAADVLPALLATGASGRAAWAFYALLPLIWIPAATGASEALRSRAAGILRLAGLSAFLASFAMMLGLMRWPTIHWELARAWNPAGDSGRIVLDALFDGLNRYLGNYVGEFLGELGFSAFFVLTGIALRRAGSRRFGSLGIATGVLGLVGIWRNVFTDAAVVRAVADGNNYLLPLWMLAFGAWLVSASRRPGTVR
ncbi:MAG: DUF4386 family protein [Thermoanaerobaculia bacterium]